MTETCNHVNLKLLEGAIHPSQGERKDYYCLQCGAQFRSEPLVIGVSFGPMPTPARDRRGE
jgi:hypothetical protein